LQRENCLTIRSAGGSLGRIPTGRIVSPLTSEEQNESMDSRPASSEKTFSEVQKFRQSWLWIILAGIAIVAWSVLLLGLPSPDPVSIIIVLVFGILFPVWFYEMKLEIRVEGGLLSYRFYGLQANWKELPLQEIESARAVVYRPILHYTGWGIRIGPKGWAYNAYGNRGVCIVRRNGKRFLLGSQRAEELAGVLQSGTGT
jgi:hypothetical protein